MAELNEIKQSAGQIQISDEVIVVIASTAAFEVEGATPAQGGGITELFGKKNNQAKSVKVVVEGEEVKIDVFVSVVYGMKLQDVASEVQEKVKTAVETMTGLTVTSVDVHVSAINVVKKDEAETE